MTDKKNRLFVVIRFVGNAVIDFHKALSDANNETHYEARDLLINASEMRQTENLLVFVVKCSEMHAYSYGITSGDFTMMYQLDKLIPARVDVYAKHKDIEW